MRGRLARGAVAGALSLAMTGLMAGVAAAGQASPASQASQAGREQPGMSQTARNTGPAGTGPASTARRAGDHVDAQRGLAAYEALQRNLYYPQYGLYHCDNTCTSDNHLGTLWPFTSAFAATGYLAAMPGAGHGLAAALSDRQRGLTAYYDPHEVDPAGQAQPPAFASEAEPPLGPGAATYYDDNAWVALDELYAYGVTHDPHDLAIAEGLFHFVVTGWDGSSSDPCPGGVFWEDAAGSARNTVSNGPNAEVGLLIYRATGQAYYLRWATRMYDWARGCLETPDGMYNDHINPDGTINTALWSYNQGTMIGAGALLYAITGSRSYLQQAEQTASASMSYYAGSKLYSQPDAFNAIYFRNLFYLAEFTHDQAYRQTAAAYAQTAWSQDRQPNGLISDPDPAGGEAMVNQTAPMAEIYALLAGSPPMPPIPNRGTGR
ncbi:MAG TPA: glycoside hydrolase family 76 protein [Streptosporangiaceae bacterium]|nr:glycoside hydrolase family 76 protein [Streptosporangiaceae bacterium]